MALEDYIASEIVLDCADGVFSRREGLRRLMLLGLSAPAAAAMLAACGSDDDSGFDLGVIRAGIIRAGIIDFAGSRVDRFDRDTGDHARNDACVGGG